MLLTSKFRYASTDTQARDTVNHERCTPASDNGRRSILS